MNMLRKVWTEEEIEKISYELAIARAVVYKKWGFSTAEIATLLDLPEATIQAALSKEE